MGIFGMRCRMSSRRRIGSPQSMTGGGPIEWPRGPQCLCSNSFTHTLWMELVESARMPHHQQDGNGDGAFWYALPDEQYGDALAPKTCPRLLLS